MYLFVERIRKEVRIMPTIFPREEKAEALFDKIAKDPRACKRLMDAFYEGVACDEDSSVEEEANKLIGTYSRYTPKDEDLFFLGLKKGDSVTIGGWIGETTTIR